MRLTYINKIDKQGLIRLYGIKGYLHLLYNEDSLNNLLSFIDLKTKTKKGNK